MIGETFYTELDAAGLVGLPFSWSSDGDFYFGNNMTQAQIDAVLAVVAAHDPSKKHRDVKAEIRAIELRELAPRFTRELSRKSVLKEAAALGLTEANLLDPGHPAYSPGYVRFMAVEAEIAALRALL